MLIFIQAIKGFLFLIKKTFDFFETRTKKTDFDSQKTLEDEYSLGNIKTMQANCSAEGDNSPHKLTINDMRGINLLNSYFSSAIFSIADQDLYEILNQRIHHKEEIAPVMISGF